MKRRACATSSGDEWTCWRLRTVAHRALASSLEVDQAFRAFIRELRGLVDFDRVTIVLVEGGRAEVLAAAGLGIADVFPPGSARPVRGSVLEEVLEGSLVYRPTLDAEQYPEEKDLLALGLRSRVLAPLQVGPRTIGMLGLVRTEVDAFSPEERSSSRCSDGWWRRPFRTSGPMTPSGRPQRSCAASRRSAPTSSRSSPTSCGARWRPSSARRELLRHGGAS